jgi:hypothetical protein
MTPINDTNKQNPNSENDCSSTFEQNPFNPRQVAQKLQESKSWNVRKERRLFGAWFTLLPKSAT